VKALLLTFDVEEFDLPVECGRATPAATQIEITARGLERVLAVLARHRAPATFFATGVFARARADLLRRLTAAGHEVGVHGLAHQDDYGLMPADAAVGRLRAARAVIEAASGAPADGVRTPHLRPCPAVRLRAAGFRYDASAHPTWVPTRYNGLRLPRRPWRDHDLVRLPISVVPAIRLPVSFIWFRAAGRLRRLAVAAAGYDAPYLHLYFHPWEAEAIRGCGVPRWLAAGCGPPFVAALDALLDWATPRLRLQTITGFLAEQPPPEPNGTRPSLARARGPR
jgi:peptidoglycan/xylan/chitin deacetylase (PgdA/CDA1 family)